MVRASELSTQVARQLDQIAVASRGKTTEEIDRAYETAEGQLLQLCGGREDVSMEIRRRVAERRFFTHCARGISFEELSVLREKIWELGFSTIEQQANVEIQFARLCAGSGSNVRATQVLNSLMETLQKETARGDNNLLKSLRSTVVRMLNEQ